MAGSTPASLSAEAPVRATAAEPRKTRSISPALETWRRFRRHVLAVTGAIVLLILVSGVLLGPYVWPVAINDIDFTAKLQGPSLAHPLGTDDLGQDLLARMMYGGRISLAVGFAAMMVALFVGVLVGSVAGMASGWVDTALMWLTDLFLALPTLPLLLLVMYLFRDSMKKILGVEGGAFVLIVVVIGGLRWMPVARLVRAQFLSLREKEFVEAARALGASKVRQVVQHILPNALGPVIVVEHLVNTARPFIFDTGLAPASVAGAGAALEVLRAEPSLAKAVRSRATGLSADLLAAGLRATVPDAAVVSVLVGGPGPAADAAARLLADGVRVGCFRPPSVPDGVSRLRLTARADLTDGEAARAVAAVAGAVRS